MKKMIKIILVITIALKVSVGAASENGPIDQVSIAQNAVQVATEALMQGSFSSTLSEDGVKRINEFNQQALETLTIFRTEVEKQVLRPLFPLIQNYQRATAQAVEGDKKIKENFIYGLQGQIESEKKKRELIYHQLIRDLLRILPDVPLVIYGNISSGGDLYEEKGDEGVYKNKNFFCFYDNTCWKKELLYSIGADVYTAKSGLKSFDFYEVERMNYVKFLKMTNLPTFVDTRNMMAEGCYTSSCYYAIKAHYNLWLNLIQSVLARQIVLVEGNNWFNVILSGGEFSNDVYSNKKGKFVLANRFLQLDHVWKEDPDDSGHNEDMINALPVHASLERVNILSQIDLSDLPCRSVSTLKNKLCHETPEGCLQDSEIELLKNRYKRKVDCL